VPLQSATLGRLNPTAQKIFRIIDNYIRENGISPTVREIAWQAGDLSTSVVGYNLDRLKEAGFITKQAGMARSIQVVGR
jgi:repressor LexA